MDGSLLSPFSFPPRFSRNPRVRYDAEDRRRNKNRFPPAVRQRTALAARFSGLPWQVRGKPNDEDVRGPSFARVALMFCVLQPLYQGFPQPSHKATAGQPRMLSGSESQAICTMLWNAASLAMASRRGFGSQRLRPKGASAFGICGPASANGGAAAGDARYQ